MSNLAIVVILAVLFVPAIFGSALALAWLERDRPREPDEHEGGLPL